MGVTVETLYEAWERELAQLRHEPDVALIAALEWRARELGFDLVELHDNVTAAAIAAEVNGPTPAPTPTPPELPPNNVDWEGMATDEEDGVTDEDLVGLPVPRKPKTAAGLVARASFQFDPDLHPRDHLGKFIETFGFIKIIGGLDKGNHGQVVDIKPNSKTPGKPTILYRQTDAKGDQVGPRLGAELAQVEAIADKARLDKPKVGPRRTDLDVELGPDTSRSPYKPLDLTGPKDYTPKASTLKPPQTAAVADEMRRQEEVAVPDVDVDDVILNFVHDDPNAPIVDLTLMTQFPVPPDGRTRADMPQIPKEHLDNFAAALDDEGVAHVNEFVDPRTLSATQTELNAKNVAELIASTRAGTFDPVNKPVWISSDNKVLDGHHRWAAAVALSMDGSDVQFPVIRVDMPMDELLDFADEFNASHGVAHRQLGEVQNRTYVRPEGTPDVAYLPQATPEGGAPDDDISTFLPPEERSGSPIPQPYTGPTRAEKAQAAQQKRDVLTAQINARAATLSTTDAEQRYSELDSMFAEMKLRGSDIDTDKVHDKLFTGEQWDGWTAERSAQHEQIWDDFLAEVESRGIPREHDALALGGLPGAGKSFSLNPNEAGEYFGVRAWEPGNPREVVDPTHVSVNPDIIKQMLMERGLTPPGVEGLSLMEQANFVHEESSALGKIFSARLGDLGYNMVLDNTMDSRDSMVKRMGPLAEEDYHFRALFADIPVDESKASARQRYIEEAFTPLGGRYVPSSLQGNAGPKLDTGRMSKNREAFDQLVAEEWFGDWLVIDNTGIVAKKPKKKVTARGTGTGAAGPAYKEAIRQREEAAAAAEAIAGPLETPPVVPEEPPVPEVPVPVAEIPAAPEAAPAAPVAPIVM